MLNFKQMKKEPLESKEFEEDSMKQKRHQQQLIHDDKMKSLGILVAGVAHEINNPNNLVMLNAPMLKKIWNNALPILEEYNEEHGDFALGGLPFKKVKERIPKLLDGITKGSSRINDMVTRLKNFSSRNELKKTPININDALKSALEFIGFEIRMSTSNFEVEYADELPVVMANRQEIEQVIINLLTNSCHSLSGRDKGIKVKTMHDVDKQKVILQVADEGSGIPKEHLDKLGDPFFTTKSDSGGTGLGLSISKSIIDSHDGVLRFLSKEGEGTTANVILPVID